MTMLCVKDQDDCSKMMLCQLNAKRATGESLSQNEAIIADSYGKGDEVDINAESLEFDIAALLGKVVSDSSRKSESAIGFFLSGII